MTHMWWKDLMKNTDLLFTVPAHVPFWTVRQFEPLNTRNLPEDRKELNTYPVGHYA